MLNVVLGFAVAVYIGRRYRAVAAALLEPENNESEASIDAL